MRKLINATLAIAGLMVLLSSTAAAQKLPKSIYIQGQAMGQSTQMGQTFNLTVIIEEYSSADDQKALLTAFNEKKNEGLVNALSKMKSKGRMSVTGTLGYDVAYAKIFPQPDGSTVLRMVTDRPLLFGEVWASTRSRDYELAGVEIVMSKDKTKKSGTLFPAARLKLNKKGELELELYQNPWKLVNIMRR